MASQLRVDNILPSAGTALGIGTASGSITFNSSNISGDVIFNDDVTVNGLLTYEDVTNIDAVGVITARSDVSIADKIIHTGDTNTAIRFPAADTFSVETGGSERLRITSAGSVGIGTDDPQVLLQLGSRTSATPQGALDVVRGEVLAGGTGPNIRLIHGPDGGTQRTHSIYSFIGDLRIAADPNENMEFHTGGGESLRISSTGAVGFNTTLVGSPQTVHIAGDYKTSTQNVADEGLIFQSFTTASTGNVYPGISWSGNPNALGRARAAITAMATNDNNGSDLIFLTRNQADGTELDVSDDQKVRITSAGYQYHYNNGSLRMHLNATGLGVNTDTITGGRLIHAHNTGTGSAYFHSTNSNTGEGANSGALFGVSGTTCYAPWNYINGPVVFATNASEKMRIHATGEVTKSSQPLAIIGTTQNNWAPSAGDVLPFNYSNTNRGNHYNTSNYTFTCPVAGDYMVILRLSRKGFRGDIELAKNNAQYALLELRETGRNNSSAADWQAWCYDFIVPCAANDTLKWKAPNVYTGTGGGNYLLDGYNHIYYDSVTYYLMG